MDGLWSRQAIQDLEYLVSDLRLYLVEKRMRALAEEVAEDLRRKYRPDQPRAPKGTPEGGQWVVDPAGQGAGDERVRVAENRDSSFYVFDFEQEYRAGRGHTWPKHIERTPAQLIDYLNQEYEVITGPNGSKLYLYHPAESSFRSAGEASYYVREVLQQNADAVERVIAGGDDEIITMRFGFPVGIQAFRADALSQPIVREAYSVRVIIRRDPRPRSRGYYVMTAFPMNDTPDEVLRGNL